MQMTTLLLKHVAGSARGHPRRGPTCRLVPLANSPSGREVAQAPGEAVTLGRPLRPHLKVVPYIIFFTVDVSLSFSLSVCPSLPPPLSFRLPHSLSPWRSPVYRIQGRDPPMRLGARWWPSGHSKPGSAHPGDDRACGQAVTSVLSSGPRPTPPIPTESHTEPSARRGRPAARPKATNSSKGISPPRRSVCCCLMNKSQANQTSLFHLWVWFGGG